MEVIFLELYQELLLQLLSKQAIQITFPDLSLDLAQFVASQCYQALCQIKAILCDDTLQDAECFQKIEAIIEVYETLGSSCDPRHDF